MSNGDVLLVQYLRRAYQAVDGLWFMMVEQADGFPKALQLDEQVWQVLAKIEAREARELLGRTGNDPGDLARCFSLKLRADGHAFECAVTHEDVCFAITGCTWYDLLRKSGRDALALTVSQIICPTEGRVWCREFGDEYTFEMPCTMCGGASRCEMTFRRTT